MKMRKNACDGNAAKSSIPLIKELAQEKVQLNVTAILTLKQVRDVAGALHPDVPAVVSVFAGRIADTGLDPVPFMAEALKFVVPHEGMELLWASPRELFNIVQGDQIGCHIITVTNDILAKLTGFGKDLEQFSLDTVRMFRTDAVAAGFTL